MAPILGDILKWMWWAQVPGSLQNKMRGTDRWQFSGRGGTLQTWAQLKFELRSSEKEGKSVIRQQSQHLQKPREMREHWRNCKEGSRMGLYCKRRQTTGLGTDWWMSERIGYKEILFLSKAIVAWWTVLLGEMRYAGISLVEWRRLVLFCTWILRSDLDRLTWAWSINQDLEMYSHEKGVWWSVV